MERNRTQLRGAALLMLTALIWGTAFVAQSVGMDHLGPCAFTAVRNYIGCVALLPVIAFASRLRNGTPEADGEPAPPAKASKRLSLWGAACGLPLGSAPLLHPPASPTAPRRCAYPPATTTTTSGASAWAASAAAASRPA